MDRKDIHSNYQTLHGQKQDADAKILVIINILFTFRKKDTEKSLLRDIKKALVTVKLLTKE